MMLYVATVTGRTSLLEPLYSPTWSSCSVVLSSSSAIHCRVAVTLVVSTSVEDLHGGHAGHADDRLARAAGQHDHARAAAFRSAGVEHRPRLPADSAAGEGRAAARGRPQRDRQRLALAVAGQVFGGKADLDQGLLEPAAVGRGDAEFERATAARPSSGATCLLRLISSASGRSAARRTSPSAARSRHQPPVARGVVADLPRTCCGTSYFENSCKRRAISSGVVPAAQAFQIDSGVMR